VIRNFRHKGLRRLYEKGDPKGVLSDHVERIARILARLDVATEPANMDLPGLRLHPLKGALKGFWAVSVSGNYRIIFTFDDGHATEVDLVDYH